MVKPIFFNLTDETVAINSSKRAFIEEPYGEMPLIARPDFVYVLKPDTPVPEGLQVVAVGGGIEVDGDLFKCSKVY